MQDEAELETLAPLLQNGMALAINNQVIDPTTVSDVACLESCSRSSATYSSITWSSDSSIEDVSQYEENESQNTPATFEPFNAVIDGSETTLHAKGQDGRTLTTDGQSQLTIGYDNSALVWNVTDDSTVANAYSHNFFGGTLKLDADVSQVGCGCQSGISLVHLNDQSCTLADIELGTCSTIELFRANSNGVRMSLDDTCTKKIEVPMLYGPEDSSWIDSQLPYTVLVKFYKNYEESSLTRGYIEINQEGKAYRVPFDDCLSTIESLSSMLKDNRMALMITNKPLDDPQSLSNRLCF